MLTRNMIQASSAASEKVRYYTEDESVLDYYKPNPEQSIGGDSVWLGALADELGLSGPVLKDELTAMMFGHAPDGTAIRWNKQRPDQEQRLVLDACLSPPKSWSIAALVCGEEILIQLHKEAVAEVAKLMEDRLAAARIQVNGHRESIQTKNLAIAALTHYTARPVKELSELLKVDPQLHTHMLIMNGTRCPDGTYRALHTEMLCAAIGMDNIYKNKLAQKAVEHGFAIRNTPNGFELEAISDELIESYSSRRTLAKALCKKQGLALTPDNIEKMTLRSRMAKKLPKTLDKMMTEWAEQGKELGLAGIPRNENAAIQGKSAREMLNSAIRHYSERSTSFTHEDIELYVFQHPQRFNEKDLGREIYCHQDLIPIGDRFTTYTALNLEKQILDQWFAGQQQAKAYAPMGMTLEHELNHKQRAVVEATLQCRDRDQLWQGISGAGKTRSLGALKKELDQHGVKVRGFAPGIQESKELARELGIETNTVASLVLQEKGLGRNELWIIDEAGKLSTKQLKTIQDKAERTGSRLLLVGDKNQNAAIEAGSPFRQLQSYGATTHRLDKIIRQQDDVQKRAVELIANGQGLESLSLLCEHGYVNEIKDADLKVEQIALDYLNLSQAERAKTLIVSGTNTEAKAITAHIREGLREEGVIEEDLEAKQVVSRQLTTEQKQQLYSYQKGDLIRLHGRNPNKTLKVGELYKVAAIHADDLTLINANGKHYRFSPKRYKKIEVYTTQDLRIAKGDRLRWTHSNRKQGRINGATVDVVAIKGNKATLQSKTGKISTVDLSKPLDLAHSLVSTSYRAQGQSQDRVLMSATADPTSMHEAFYVAISRQKWFLKIYTQNLDKIKAFITQSNTQKNALELIHEQHRIEAERYRSAIESARNARHHHPFLYSAVASLAASAIRRHHDEQLVRQQLEGLCRGIETAYHGIQQLNRQLTRQARPVGERRLTFIQQYQTIEAEFDQFLSESEVELKQNFDLEIQTQLAESESLDWQSAPLGEYCPVDNQSPKAIAIQNRASELNISITTLQRLSDSNSIQRTNAFSRVRHDKPRGEQPNLEASSSIETSNGIGRTLLTQGYTLELSELTQNQFSSLPRKAVQSQFEFIALESQHHLEPEVIQLARPINVTEPLEGIHYDSNTRQSLQRATIDGVQQFEISHPATESIDQAERNRHSELAHQGRPRPIYGEDLEQGETRQVQHWRYVDQSQAINREGYRRSPTEPRPYPGEWQLDHGQPTIPQSNHPGDWCDALADYRVLKEIASPLNDVIDALHKLQSARQELDKARLLRVVPEPKLIPVFWEPKYKDRDRPQQVLKQHWEEFKKSAIHPDLIKLNLASIEGWAVQMRLLEDKLNQMSSGQFPTQPMIRLMNRYQGLCEAGGWWGTAGVDPFNDWKPSRWGCFKGDEPRIVDGEPVKYEHPLGTERQFFLANIPDWLAKDILAKHGIEFHEGDSFWKIVHENNLPIIYIEGSKKSLAALSQGEIAIGIPGVNALYRANEKVNGEKFRLPERELTKPAQFWATPGRDIRWAFDKDMKLKSILNVQRDMVRAIELMPQNTHQVLDWNAKHKGVDDLIAQAGPRAFARSVERAGPADRFIKAHYRRLYNQYRRHGINDAQIWLSAAREGDIHDGDRVLAQSDTARKNPAKAESYVKQQKAIALGLMQRSSNTDLRPSQANIHTRSRRNAH